MVALLFSAFSQATPLRILNHTLGIFSLAAAWLLWKTGKLTVADKGTFPDIAVQIIATIGRYLMGLSVYRLISGF